MLIISRYNLGGTAETQTVKKMLNSSTPDKIINIFINLASMANVSIGIYSNQKTFRSFCVVLFCKSN